MTTEISNRGTGRTTQQMRDAPHGACFVWNNEQLEYAKRLAAHLERPDLTIIGPSQDLDYGGTSRPHLSGWDHHRGRTWTVVRDHACSH